MLLFGWLSLGKQGGAELHQSSSVPEKEKRRSAAKPNPPIRSVCGPILNVYLFVSSSSLLHLFFPPKKRLTAASGSLATNQYTTKSALPVWSLTTFSIHNLFYLILPLPLLIVIIPIEQWQITFMIPIFLHWMLWHLILSKALLKSIKKLLLPI